MRLNRPESQTRSTQQPTDEQWAIVDPVVRLGHRLRQSRELPIGRE